MKKKAYLKPQMKVVEIKFQPQLMAGSVVHLVDEYAGEDIPGLAPKMYHEFDEFDEFEY